MEKKSDLSKAQLAVLIGAIFYIVMPDLIIGPFDDAGIAFLAGIAELILAIVRACSGPEVVENTTVFEEPYDFYNT